MRSQNTRMETEFYDDLVALLDKDTGYRAKRKHLNLSDEDVLRLAENYIPYEYGTTAKYILEEALFDEKGNLQYDNDGKIILESGGRATIIQNDIRPEPVNNTLHNIESGNRSSQVTHIQNTVESLIEHIKSTVGDNNVFPTHKDYVDYIDSAPGHKFHSQCKELLKNYTFDQEGSLIKKVREVNFKYPPGFSKLETFVNEYMKENVACTEEDAIMEASKVIDDGALKEFIDRIYFDELGNCQRTEGGGFINGKILFDICKIAKTCSKSNVTDLAMFHIISELMFTEIKNYICGLNKDGSILYIYRWNNNEKLWKPASISDLKYEIIEYARFFINEYKDHVYRELYNEILDESSRALNEDEKKEKLKFIDKCMKVFDFIYTQSQNLSQINRVITILLPCITDNEFLDKICSSMYEFPLKNGKIIDFQTGNIRDRTKTDYFTSECPVEYNPDCSTDLALNFMNEIFLPDKLEIVNYLQQVLGSCLTNSIKDRSFYVLYGPKGANGKSTLMKIMKIILGNYFHDTSPDVYIKNKSAGREASLQKIQLKSCRLSCLSEIDSFDILNEQELKRMTGDDGINARDHYKNDPPFIPKFKCFLPTNNLPRISSDNAVWNRAVIIKFECEFVDNPTLPHQRKLIPDFLEKLPNNIPFLQSFLKWIIDGAITFTHSSSISKPAEISELKEIIKYNVNDIEVFIQEKLERVPNEKIKPTDLHQAFKSWATDSKRTDLLKKYNSASVFGNEIGKFLTERKRDKVSCWYLNYRIKETENQPTNQNIKPISSSSSYKFNQPSQNALPLPVPPTLNALPLPIPPSQNALDVPTGSICV